MTIVANAIGGHTLPVGTLKMEMNSLEACEAFKAAFLAEPDMPNTNTKFESGECKKKEEIK